MENEISDERLEYLIGSLSRGRDGRSNVSDDMRAAAKALIELRDRRSVVVEAVAWVAPETLDRLKERDRFTTAVLEPENSGFSTTPLYLHPSNSALAVNPLEQFVGSCPSCNGTGDQGGNPSYGACEDCEGGK